ncbi:hypothetical protein Tco_0577562 [Tanacetum coccineum]
MLEPLLFNLFMKDGTSKNAKVSTWVSLQVVNNKLCGWGNVAVGGVGEADAPEAESMKWNWRTDKDKLENGAVFVPSGSDPELTPDQKAGLIED